MALKEHLGAHTWSIVAQHQTWIGSTHDNQEDKQHFALVALILVPELGVLVLSVLALRLAHIRANSGFRVQ